MTSPVGRPHVDVPRSRRDARRVDPWNINIHYDALLARLAPPGSRVLDVGCGDGFLAARLAESGCEVVALDTDAPVLERARDRWGGRASWVHGDLMTYEDRSGFDAVLSNATLHHLPDTGAALARMRDLVRRGGRLGVVGFARNGPLDWPMSLAGAVGIAVVNHRHHKWEHTAPQCWPPALTYGQVRRASGSVLPGRSFRRLWLGRYLLTWSREGDHPGHASVA